MKKSHLMLLASFLIILAVVARLTPHISNFSPIIAIALFSGAVFKSNKWFYLVPVSALLVSDFFLGFHSLSPVIYLVLGLIAVFGLSLNSSNEDSGLRKNIKLLKKTTLAAVFFFLTTNLAVFFLTPMYSTTWSGLVECYTLALPFFRNTLVSSLLYSAVLFNVYSLLSSRAFSASPLITE